MKVFGNILKVLVALAAIAGLVYVVATYGDKIVAWAKKMLGKNCCTSECCCEEAVEEVIKEEAPAEEAPAEDSAVQAEEADFEG